MAYEPYVTPEYYRETYGGSQIPENELERALTQASRHIDSIPNVPQCLLLLRRSAFPPPP